LIISTGMATLEEIREAVQAASEEGAREVVLLKCTSAYPSPPEEMNLASIPHLAATFGVPVGLSDHTLGVGVPLAGVALGAVMVEKHVTLSRAVPGPDSAFSLEPHELAEMVQGIRVVEKAIGNVDYTVTDAEQSNQVFRRSLFVTSDMKQGDEFTSGNVRSVRPGYGLKPRHLPDVLGRRAARDIKRGTALNWTLVG
jgi:pseudaminic acid synthase